jgi:hypothetical protein
MPMKAANGMRPVNGMKACRRDGLRWDGQDNSTGMGGAGAGVLGGFELTV